MDSEKDTERADTAETKETICDTGQKMETDTVVNNKDPPEGGDNGEATSELKPESGESSENVTQSQPQESDTTVDVEKKEEDEIIKDMVTFKVVYNKQKFDVTFPLDDTVTSLKSHIESLTKVPSSMQKVMFKGKMRDEETLRGHGVLKGSKIMVIGSTVTDVMSVSAPDAKTMKEIEKQNASANKEPLCKMKPHKTVLEKHGKPEDVMIGVKKHKEPLPPAPLTGMYNKSGGKVRLTFKLEQDQLWIGTKERTEKISMGSIKAVVSEPIEGNEEYHLVGIQLGPTEASRYWVYWVPAQYVDAIKDAVLGKWQTELF